MKLVTDFYNYIEKIGIQKDAIYEENGNEFTLVSFSEEGEKELAYNIALVLYSNDDIVEIYIRKPIQENYELSILKRLNLLNSEYCGVTFCYENDIVCVKSCCKTSGNIEIAFAQLVQNMQLAKTEFPKFS
ncbi:MAG: hypothetical protein R3Y54_01955 [Eubacteriales bacterium]